MRRQSCVVGGNLRYWTTHLHHDFHLDIFLANALQVHHFLDSPWIPLGLKCYNGDPILVTTFEPGII